MKKINATMTAHIKFRRPSEDLQQGLESVAFHAVPALHSDFDVEDIDLGKFSQLGDSLGEARFDLLITAEEDINPLWVLKKIKIKSDDPGVKVEVRGFALEDVR